MALPLSSDARQLHYLESRLPLAPFSQFALNIAVTLVKWDDRYRTRRSLKRLTDDQLSDIGYSREAANTEAARMFWRT